MIKYVVTLILFIAVLIPQARAQITVEAGEMEELIGTVLEARMSIQEEPEVTPELEALVAADGEGDTYDFSDIAFEGSITGTLTFMTPAPDVVGYAYEYFRQADMVTEMQFDGTEIDTTIVMWQYATIEDDGIYSLGVIVVMDDINEDGQPDTLALDFDPPLFQSPLSYTYGDSWEAEQLFGGEAEVEVTGYGTLITPDGSAHQALRVERVTEIFGFETRSIEFVTESDGGYPAASATIDVGVLGEITSVNFTEVTGEVGTSTETGDLPERFTLEQNYPNPFNPATTISFEMREAGHVSIKVYDALGREVATLVDGTRTAGSHSVSFEAADLPSGTYIYRMSAGGVEKSQMMTLLK